MNNGWVKLHRQILENETFRHDPTAWHVFEVLLLVVSQKDGKWSGGRKQLAELACIKEGTLYDALKRLESQQMVNRSTNSRYTVYRICKWGEYQQGRQQVRQQPTNSPPTADQHSNKNKELELEKNVSKDTLAKPVYGDPNINALFDYWELTVGYALISNKQKNRNACSNLLKRIGEDKVKQLIDGVAMSQEDRYAPRISDFAQLQLKLNDLLEWGKRRNKSYAKAEF